jgi:hypothetical protein
MTIFTVLLPTPSQRIIDAIKAAYPDNWLALNETQYLVSSTGTVYEVSAKIGVADLNDRGKPAIGNAVLFATSSYYGRAPTPVWDWIKAALR